MRRVKKARNQAEYRSLVRNKKVEQRPEYEPMKRGPRSRLELRSAMIEEPEGHIKASGEKALPVPWGRLSGLPATAWRGLS